MRQFKALVGLDIVATLCVFSIYAGTLSPDVNESHYLTKAKNFWDTSFCRGDLFLESADAHWFFFWMFGAPTLYFSLPVAAWIGRIVCWLTIAWGWSALMRSISPLRLAGLATAPMFLACVHWGHLSGEWVVGGCEAKTLAYGFAFLGTARAFENRWSSSVIFFGLAASFHIVTGGWIFLSLVAAILVSQMIAQGDQLDPESRAASWQNLIAQARSSKFIVAFAICIGFTLVGLIPAAALNAGVDAATADRAAINYVFKRLPHHLTYRGFTSQRWASHLTLVTIALILAVLYWILNHSRARYSPSIKRDPTAAAKLLLLVTVMGPVLAIIGFLIDWSLTSWATNWSAGLLRYYWFRWNDVAWAVAVCVLLFGLLEIVSRWPLNRLKHVVQFALWSILLVPGCALCTQRYLKTDLSTIPPADEQALLMQGLSLPEREKLYDNWIAACRYIRQSTPPDALFLTPRYQQTFKWNAQRAEIVCWKDSPQNAADLVAWYDRIQTVFPKNQFGQNKSLNMVRIIDLYRKYGFQYLLVDRLVDPNPVTLPLLYENENYAVFEMIRL